MYSKQGWFKEERKKKHSILTSNTTLYATMLGTGRNWNGVLNKKWLSTAIKSHVDPKFSKIYQLYQVISNQQL